MNKDYKDTEEFEKKILEKMNTSSGKKGGLKHWQKIAGFLIVFDLLAVNLAYAFALWLRFDCQFNAIPENYYDAWLMFVPIYSVFCIVLFHFMKLYRSMWRFASFNELTRVFLACVIATLFHIVGITLIFERMPISYYFIGAVVQFILVLGIRFSYRFMLLERSKRDKTQKEARAKRVMLIGAGNAGQMIIRDIHAAKEVKDRICCIIDDNHNKWKRYIDGIPIVGGREAILENAKKYDIEKIYIAIPSLSTKERQELLEICKETGCELKSLPGMYQFVTGDISVNAMKEVAIEDLLGREPIKPNLEEVFHAMAGKDILVTGGGGSIGSELCRQIAAHHPKRLIIFDVYENNAYEIQLELRKKYPNLDLVTLIGSVRDSRRIEEVFTKYKPNIVYHAAAHKHVPLMETSPSEAIKNNAVGTYKVAYAAMIHGCERFVLISTDKAVNPTNIMGASKRICEMIVQTFDKKIKENKEHEMPNLRVHGELAFDSHEPFRIHGTDNVGYRNARTEFVAVRFGNVLGSNGSVIPLFKKQIAAGGPITVTHPDITRYFMTIPEAVSLVLQAGSYAHGGEIFVLDMGEPVKIDTLARNLIKLSGLKPDEDIKIVYSGLRPGEKLYEEKLMSEEGLKTTPNKLIHIGCPIPFDEDEFIVQLEQLLYAAYTEGSDIRGMVEKMVPTYHPVD